MSTKFKKGVLAAGIVTTVATIGLMEGRFREPTDIIHKSVTVPLCAYVVQPGDGMQNLFKMQIKSDDSEANFQNAPLIPNGSNQIVLYGGKSDNQKVQFILDVDEITALLNPDLLDKARGILRKKLSVGEEVLIPDLNSTGKLNGKKCDAGTVTFDGTFNRLTTVVKKAMFWKTSQANSAANLAGLR